MVNVNTLIQKKVRYNFKKICDINSQFPGNNIMNSSILKFVHVIVFHTNI